MHWPDCMVDVETTGLHPDRAAVIQIAAVKFDLRSQNVCHDFFNEALTIPPWRMWEESTLLWWQNQKVEILEDIYRRMRPASVVIEEFRNWVIKGQFAPRFWSKPLSFDFPFVASVFTDAQITNPFDFRQARDLRSFLAGMTYPDFPLDERSVPFEGDVHNALFDALHQIKYLFAAVAACRKTSSLPLT